MAFPLRDVFDVPDLATTHDDIVNGRCGYLHDPDGSAPLAPVHRAARGLFAGPAQPTTPRPLPEHFQNHVLFTNYQFYVEEFEAYARRALADPDSRLHQFRGHAGQLGDDRNLSDPQDRGAGEACRRCPSYHLTRDRTGRGYHSGQYRCGAVQRQDRDRPHCCFAPARLADGRPLRRSTRNSQSAGGFRAGPCLSARGQGAG